MLRTGSAEELRATGECANLTKFDLALERNEQTWIPLGLNHDLNVALHRSLPTFSRADAHYVFDVRNYDFPVANPTGVRSRPYHSDHLVYTFINAKDFEFDFW